MTDTVDRTTEAYRARIRELAETKRQPKRRRRGAPERRPYPWVTDLEVTPEQQTRRPPDHNYREAHAMKDDTEPDATKARPNACRVHELAETKRDAKSAYRRSPRAFFDVLRRGITHRMSVK